LKNFTVELYLGYLHHIIAIVTVIKLFGFAVIYKLLLVRKFILTLLYYGPLFVANLNSLKD